MGRLDGKVAIVTGGAMGIGEMTCRMFAREGAAVVVADVADAAGARLAQELNAQGGQADFLHLDVSSEAEWESVIEETVRRFGRLNVLVNNAGIAVWKGILDTTLEDWERVMRVNATGTYLGTRLAILAMKGNGENCSIINHSSVSGQVGDHTSFAYCASKGAVTLLTKSAAITCCQERLPIRVNSVHPAVVRTTITQQQIDNSNEGEDAVLQRLAALNPIGRLGTPEDIAWADVYLASDESLFVTGSELNVDGGWTAQ